MSVNWLKVKAVATRLSVSEKTVYNWLKAGQLSGRKVGKSWVIAEDALDRLIYQPPAPTAKVPQRVDNGLSIVDAAKRFASIVDGAARNGILKILEPRRKSADANNQMDDALNMANGEIMIAGIGLPAFFNDQGRHIFTLRRMQAEDRAVHIRALLLHPASEFAKSRVRLEAQNEQSSNNSLTLSPFYVSSVRSMHLITAMRQGMHHNKRYKLEAKFAHYWPSAHILLTDSVCFVEGYHFGLFVDASGGHAEGNVPVLVAEAGSDLYEAMKLHFEYVWTGNDSQIQIRTLEQTAQDIQPNE